MTAPTMLVVKDMGYDTNVFIYEARSANDYHSIPHEYGNDSAEGTE